MIDLSPDPRRARRSQGACGAHVLGGSLLGDLDHEAMALGLVTPTGTVSDTGVRRAHARRRLRPPRTPVGTSARQPALGGHRDRRRRAAAREREEHPDLLWALRGGGGNFGVVTDFEFQLHPMDREVIGGNIVFPLSQAKPAARLLRRLPAHGAGRARTRRGPLQHPWPGRCLHVSGILLQRPQKPRRRDPGDDSQRGHADRRSRQGCRLRGAAEDPATTTTSRGRASTRSPASRARRRRRSSTPLLDGFEARPERGTIFGFQQGGGAINRVATRRHGVRAPRHHAHAAARHRLGHSARPERRHRVAPPVLGERRAAHLRLLHGRGRRRADHRRRTELPGQPRTPAPGQGEV